MQRPSLAPYESLPECDVAGPYAGEFETRVSARIGLKAGLPGFDDYDDVAAPNSVANGNADLFDGAGDIGGDVVFHLHCLEYQNRVASVDCLADLDVDLDDRALHRHRYLAVACATRTCQSD